MRLVGSRANYIRRSKLETLDPRGNVRANTANYQTSRPNAFSAGDMRRGQSLVVRPIRVGRLCARAIDEFLMATTDLPR
jgi:glutamate synthase (NADPH/NADH) small chain